MRGAKGHEEKKADSHDTQLLSLEMKRDATLEEGFVGARGVNDSSLEMGLYAGVSTKTDDDSEYPYANDELRPSNSVSAVTSVAEDIHTGKFHGNKTLAAGGVTNNDVSNGSSQEESHRGVVRFDSQLQPGSRKNILTFQYRDFLIEITLGLLTRVVTLCAVYVLHSRGSEAMAYMIVISLWALHYTPYTVFLIDYIYPHIVTEE